MTFSPKHSKITSEAIRAELRLLKEDESRIEALRSAIDEGVQSGIAAGFTYRWWTPNRFIGSSSGSDRLGDRFGIR